MTATVVDASERADMISATVANYISGEFGTVRAQSLLVMCGLNAKEIEDLLEPHRAVAFENFKHRKRGPVK